VSFRRSLILCIVAQVACSAGIGVGFPPHLALAPRQPVPLRFVIDGSYDEDLDRTIDWLISGNRSSVVRVRDASAAAVIYLSTSGTPSVSSTCDTRMRALDPRGAPITDGMRTHNCGWPNRHGDGLRSIAVWAIEETILGLQRATPPSSGAASSTLPSSPQRTEPPAPLPAPRPAAVPRRRPVCSTSCPRALRDADGCCPSR